MLYISVCNTYVVNNYNSVNSVEPPNQIEDTLRLVTSFSKGSSQRSKCFGRRLS